MSIEVCIEDIKKADDSNKEDNQTQETEDDKISDQLFEQDSNEEEDFEIPAFLRRQKF